MLKKEAAQARLRLFVSKCHIVENFMSRLKCLCFVSFRHVGASHTLLDKLG